MASARHACKIGVNITDDKKIQKCKKWLLGWRLTPQKTCLQGLSSIPRFFIFARLASLRSAAVVGASRTSPGSDSASESSSISNESKSLIISWYERVGSREIGEKHTLL